jgi:hypothetical protein
MRILTTTIIIMTLCPGPTLLLLPFPSLCVFIVITITSCKVVVPRVDTDQL